MDHFPFIPLALTALTVFVYFHRRRQIASLLGEPHEYEKQADYAESLYAKHLRTLLVAIIATVAWVAQYEIGLFALLAPVCVLIYVLGRLVFLRRVLSSSRPCPKPGCNLECEPIPKEKAAEYLTELQAAEQKADYKHYHIWKCHEHGLTIEEDLVTGGRNAFCKLCKHHTAVETKREGNWANNESKVSFICHYCKGEFTRNLRTSSRD